MNETLKELLVLAAKYREKKYRLNSADSEVAREKLQTLFLDASSIGEACRQIAALPESCCRAFLDAWEESDDSHKEQLVRVLLGEPVTADKPGVIRMIKLISDFIPIDQWAAFKLLSGMSKQKTRDGTEQPPPWVVKRFWNELVTPKKLFNISLDNQEISNHEITALAVMVISGLLENQQENNTLACDLFRWLEQCPGKIIPGKNLTAEIEKTTKYWPVGLQRQCQKLGLVKTVSYSIAEKPEEGQAFLERSAPRDNKSPLSEQPDAPQKPSAQDQDDQVNVQNATTRSDSPDNNPVPSADICLEWLSRHISSMAKENLTLANKLRLLETDCFLFKNKSKEQENLLAEIRELLDQKEKVIQEQSERIAALEKKGQELENTLQEEKTARGNEVENLKNRIDRECNFVREEFKNILTDRLLLHYRGYCEARVKPPSVQLASYLDYLLQRIFRELVNLGIKLDGEI